MLPGDATRGIRARKRLRHCVNNNYRQVACSSRGRRAELDTLRRVGWGMCANPVPSSSGSSPASPSSSPASPSTGCAGSGPCARRTSDRGSRKPLATDFAPTVPDAAALRQLAGRARPHVEERKPRYDVDPAQRRDLTERSLAAAAGGDLDALLAVLAPDVRLVGDSGGKPKGTSADSGERGQGRPVPLRRRARSDPGPGSPLHGFERRPGGAAAFRWEVGTRCSRWMCGTESSNAYISFTILTNSLHCPASRRQEQAGRLSREAVFGFPGRTVAPTLRSPCPASVPKPRGPARTWGFVPSAPGPSANVL